jgi:hypothetical protein
MASFELTDEEWGQLCSRFQPLKRGREIESEGLRITHIQGTLVRVALSASQAFKIFGTCGAYMVAELVQTRLADLVKPKSAT